MGTLGSILNTGRQALLIQQLAMQVIGQNTSNVNTEGYSRRRIELGTAPGLEDYGKWQVGSGVDVSHLGRVRDTLLDDQIRQSSTEVGYWNQQDDALGQVEKVFSEMSGSAISDNLQAFWASWQDLSNDPENTVARTSVLQKAQSLTSNIQRTYSELSQQRDTVDKTIVDKVAQVNSLTTQIAKLNTQIVASEVSGSEASDLRDARDLAIQNLSSLIKINVKENSDGAVNVYNNGMILVQIDKSNDLKITTDSQTGYPRTLISYSYSGAPADLGSGEIKSLLDVRDNQITSAMKNLDTFASTLAKRVNEVHRTGYGLTNTNGIDFFDPSTTGAANIKVSNLITDDVSRIATASSANAPGDNTLVLKIASIQSEKLLDGGASTLDDYYQSVVLKVSSKKAYAADQLAIETTTADHLESRKQQISGVSMDEEMTHLIQVQQAYDAASKIITTIDQMMTTVIDMKQ
jgi:flagellar hook-associated protein 1